MFRLGDNRTVDAERDVADEMQLHLELRVREFMAEGMSEADARKEAARRFASSAATMQSLYHTAMERNETVRLRERIESWVQDTRYAMRGLGRDRMLTVFIVLTLALGIGANVTSFTFVDRLLLRGPAHVVRPRELMRLYLRFDKPPRPPRTAGWMPYETYMHLHDNMRTIADMGAYGVRETLVGRGVDARRLRVGIATGAFLHVLGVRPIRGRIFTPDEDAAITGPIAIISEDLWRTRFNADPDIVGKQIIVGEAEASIIGVTPHGFSGGEPRRVDIWTLVNTRTARTINWRPVARARPGVTLAMAQTDAQAAHLQTLSEDQDWIRPATIVAAPLHYGETAEAPPEATMARWLSVVTAMILIITFANVINLMLVRLTRRTREIAIRVALGSGRARVVRLVAIEGVILAVAAAVVSIGIARVIEPVVRESLLSGDAAWTSSIDSHTIAIICILALVTSLVVGVIPAVQAGNPRISGALQATGHSGGTHASTRNALTVVQAALSVVLLFGAVLFVRSLQQVRAVDLGLQPDQVIVATADLPPLTDFSKEGFRAHAEFETQAFQRMVQRVRTMPAVAHAAVSVGLPLDGGSFSIGVHVDGIDSVRALPGGGPYVAVVGPDYFTTMGTRIVRGRAFDGNDRPNGQRVVIIGEAMARALWPHGDALGRCIRLQASRDCLTVVGVAADVHRVGLEEEPSMQLYLALGQPSPFSGANIVIRTRPGATLSWPELRSVILAAEPSARAAYVSSLSDALNGAVHPLRLGLVTFGMSGILALVVAALGLYSLMAYTVAWRTREIGVRMALGASTSGITRLVIGDGTRLATVGIAIGVFIALIGGRWLQPQLFHVSARDPFALVAVAIVLLAVAGFAGWVPARRAVRISPTEALRVD